MNVRGVNWSARSVCARFCGCYPYHLLQSVAATEIFELRVRAGSLASVSVSSLARKVLLHIAIWQRHINTHRNKQ